MGDVVGAESAHAPSRHKELSSLLDSVSEARSGSDHVGLGGDDDVMGGYEADRDSCHDGESAVRNRYCANDELCVEPESRVTSSVEEPASSESVASVTSTSTGAGVVGGAEGDGSGVEDGAVSRGGEAPSILHGKKRSALF